MKCVHWALDLFLFGWKHCLCLVTCWQWHCRCWGSDGSPSLIRCAALTLRFLLSAKTSWRIISIYAIFLKILFSQKLSIAFRHFNAPRTPQGRTIIPLTCSLDFPWHALTGFRKDNRWTWLTSRLDRLRQLEMLHILKEVSGKHFCWTVTKSGQGGTESTAYWLLKPLSDLPSDTCIRPNWW